MNNNAIGRKIKSIEDEINKYLENTDDLYYNLLECYIMKNEYKTILSRNSSRKNLISSDNDINHYYIDNFNDAIKYLRKGGHLEYSNKEIMGILQDNNDFIKLHHISCVYILKRKIIIDFNDNNDCNKSLLIISSNQKNLDDENDENIFIINNKNIDKMELFKSLLSEDIDELSDLETIKQKYKDYLEEIEDYFNNMIDEKGGYQCGCDNIFHDEKKMGRIRQKFEILIMIYYYEKLIKNNDMPNSIQYNYYLIKSEWIEKYKNYYYYNDLSYLLDEEIDNNINFNIIDSYKGQLSEKYLKKYIKLLPSNVLLNSGFIYRKGIKAPLFGIKNLNYYHKCYIIPDKIFDLIIKIEYNKNPSAFKINTNEILSNFGKIFLYLDSKNIAPININLGNMEGLLFNINYIITYFSQNDYNNFKNNYLFKKSINQYLRQINCNENSNEIQIMKNKNGKIIGILLKLNPQLDIMEYQLFTRRIGPGNSHSLRKINKNQYNYSPSSTIYTYKYKNYENSSILRKKVIKKYKNREFNLNENNQNKEKELIEEKEKIIEDYKNKEQKLNEEKENIIEDYKNKEKKLNEEKEKIIEDYKKEKKLNEEKEKIIEDYKNKEKKLDSKILEFEENKKIIENYKNNEEKLNAKILLLEKQDKKNQNKIEEQSRKEIQYEAEINDLNKKIDLNKNILDKNIQEMANLEKVYKKLQSDYQNLKQKSNVLNSENEDNIKKERELKKNILDKEKYIKQLELKIEKLSKKDEDKFDNNNSNKNYNPYNRYDPNNDNHNNNSNIYRFQESSSNNIEIDSGGQLIHTGGNWKILSSGYAEFKNVKITGDTATS